MKHIRTGALGEEAAANHLKRKGYAVLERNYRKKWGEIDIIARYEGIVHFMEVKTVSRETKKGVPRETWRAEENVTPHKILKLTRAIDTWISENNYEGDWQIDVAAVYLDRENKKATINIIEQITLD